MATRVQIIWRGCVFLSKHHSFADNIFDEEIDRIVNAERLNLNGRAIYGKERDVRNFQSALRKFKAFCHSNYSQRARQQIESEIEQICNDTSITQTEKAALIQSRVGQGLYRSRLIEYWGGCSISGCNMQNLLIASHIKPWKDSSNDERLNVYNGLLLLPNFDKLFDKGSITVTGNGEIVVSKYLSEHNRVLFGIDHTLKLSKYTDNHRKFMEYHNRYCFLE